MEQRTVLFGPKGQPVRERDALAWVAVLVRMLEEEGFDVEVTQHELDTVDPSRLVVTRDPMRDVMYLRYDEGKG